MNMKTSARDKVEKYSPVFGCVLTLGALVAIIWFLVHLFSAGRVNDILTEEEKHGSYPIEAVYMHTAGSYSVAVLKDGQLNIDYLSRIDTHRPKNFHYDEETEILIPDVPEDEQMYVEYQRRITARWDLGSTTNVIYKIHIHSVKNVNGGDWRAGKMAHGRTEVISN